VSAAWARGTWRGLRERSHFSEVEKFLIFIGYPRSGHTMIGSLLNAHADMVVSHELNVFQYVHRGFNRSALYGLIFERDREFAAMGRQWEGYDYTVPGQHQGEVDRLRIIGDKRAAVSNLWLSSEPELLDRLRRTVGVPLRVLHITRNPYDNIATMSRRTYENVARALTRYTMLCEGVERIRSGLAPDELLDLRYESFLADPRAALRTVCRFLGVEATDSYLDGCSDVVWGSGSRSRDMVEWTDEEREQVAILIARHRGFEGYAFEE
jgi:hypothetical protein